MRMTELKQKFLKYELKQAGFTNAEYIAESDAFKVQPNDDNILTIYNNGEIQFKDKYYELAVNTIIPIVSKVNEIIRAWEKSPPMPFKDVSNFRLLAEYNNVVLAARDDNDKGYGFHFVTWEYGYNRNGVCYGHYTTDYIGAKEDFAIRSGLVKKEKLVSLKQEKNKKSSKSSVLTDLDEKKKEVNPASTGKKDKKIEIE